MLTSASVLQLIHGLVTEYNCTSVYFDAGSNIGVQIRKLYQPEWYVNHPDMALKAALPMLHKDFEGPLREAQARIMRLQDDAFGPAPRCHVCSIGFEPNPAHQPRLQHLQRTLRAAGAGVLVVHAGLSSSDGTLPLQGVGALGHSADMTQTGVALRHHTPASAHPSVSVPTVDFATVLLGVRALLGRSANGKKIVMKMDLEAEEYRVFPHLIRRSALCELDVVYVEWHPKVCSKKEPKVGPKALCNRTKHLRAHSRLLYDFRQTIRAATEQDCHTALHDLDDEYHATDGAPWPSKLCGDLSRSAESPWAAGSAKRLVTYRSIG